MRLRLLGFLCLAFPFLAGWGHWGPKVKIGLFLHQGQDYKILIDRLKAEVEENRGELVVKEVENPLKEKVEVQDLLQQGLQALVMIPGDTLGDSAYDTPLMKVAHQAGIKVVSLNENVWVNPDVDYIVGYNGVKAGEWQAQALVKKVPRGRYLILGNSSEYFSIEIQKGQMKILQPFIDRGEIQVDTESPHFLAMDQASKRVLDRKRNIGLDYFAPEKVIFKKEGEIVDRLVKQADAILTADNLTTQEVIQSLKKLGLAGKIPVVGIGGDLETCRGIVSGTLMMTVYSPPKKLAEEAAYLTAKLARKATQFDCQFTEIDNGNGKVKAVLLTPLVVDAKNLDSTIIQDGVQKREEVYGK